LAEKDPCQKMSLAEVSKRQNKFSRLVRDQTKRTVTVTVNSHRVVGFALRNIGSAGMLDIRSRWLVFILLTTFFFDQSKKPVSDKQRVFDLLI
jgi:hypothetical protein